MSSDNGTGRKARKIMTVMAAVFAVAIMVAVPFLSAADSEASFTKGEGGYCITAKDAPDDKLAEYGLYSKATTIKTNEGTELFLKIFNTYAFDTPTVDCESFTVKDYAGMKVETDRTEVIEGTEVTIEKVRMEYTGIGGALLSDAYDSYGQAVAAIRAEFGTDDVSAGDKLIITGNIKSRFVEKDPKNYAKVDDTHSVVKDGSAIRYYLYDIDVTIEFKHGDVSKTITFYSNQKYQVDTEATYDYKGKEYKDLKEGDKCDISYEDKYYFESGSTYYKVDGKEYKIDIYGLTPEKRTDQEVVFFTDEEEQYLLNLVIKRTTDLPGSEGNVTVGKSYSDAESAYSDLAASVAMNDILKLLLIIGGVIIGVLVLIVILIIVLIVLKKKKKNQ